ncbi:hypothetical protein DB32_003626 [Sandaracinus amylolyticus]|uniref:Dickkopf N-terminal cysteine-rich domain-containing protein n=1 Tax=Sandaracinus amylolyticus TaxID=927083 RepID=A0A0F6W3N2_9BACT|nr:hypothetical protein DB32_003626 [Sandaracinus amylolyticus]
MERTERETVSIARRRSIHAIAVSRRRSYLRRADRPISTRSLRSQDAHGRLPRVMPAARRAFLAVLVASLAVACSSARGDRRTGQRCADDRECQRGLCVAGVRGEEPVCTVSCASDGECPQGWTCHGVTQANVLVCASGGATPFDPTGQH